MKFIKKAWDKLNELSTNSVNSFGAQYDAYAIFIFIFYVINPFKWHFWGPYSLSAMVVLRIIAFVLWVMLVFWRKWPTSMKRYLPLFWHFSLFFHLPFRATFGVLYASYSPSFDSFGILGIVALAILVDNKAFCVLSILGIVFGTLTYYAFGGFVIPYVSYTTVLYAALMLISIAFIKLILFRNFNNMMQERSRAYLTLAGAIAHEVRTPLCTLNVICENAQTFTPEHIAIVKRQSRAALNIIESILLQIRYVDRKVQLKSERVAIRPCIEQAVTDALTYEDDRRFISVDAPDDLFVLADEQVVRQIIINLVKNALWAIREAGRDTITISGYKDDASGKVKLSVYDNGVGINQRMLKKIFEPFFTRSTQGAGIGLAFCQLAVESLGGSITAESKEHEYTRFTVTLPDADVVADASKKKPKTSRKLF